MKIIMLLLLSLFSLAALAHTGHGGTSAFSHDLEHALWYTGVAIFLSFVMLILRKKGQ